MKTKIQNLLRPSGILVLLFLVFLFYVGYAALPVFVYNTLQIVQGKESPRSFIRQTNDQYETMLETGNEYPFLHSKDTYINLNGLMANLLGQPMMNNRLTLTNGHLTEVEPQAPDPETIRETAENLIRFHDLQTGKGGHFLFVLAPGQISKYENLLPAGYEDTTNATADTLLGLLKDADVPCLDLREQLHKDGISVTDAFFVTDHHWTPQTGLWAFGRILEKLESIRAISPVDARYTDPANYTFDTYENTFLGSSGRRTGIYYGGIDDSVFLRPNFHTDIQVRIPEREVDLRGRYEDVSYSPYGWPDFEKPDYFRSNSYGLYGWGDTGITHWRNENADQEEKFLLIGESFGNIPYSLMSLCFSSCDELDMRHYSDDFAAYYAAYAPDTVILEVNIGMTISENTIFPYPG